MAPYFGGGAGMNPSRLRPGSGLGLGFGAFFASFLPLSLLPMDRSVPQMGRDGKERNRGYAHAMKQFACFGVCIRQSRAMLLCIDVGAENGIHAGQVALAARFEPVDHIAVKAQMH